MRTSCLFCGKPGGSKRRHGDHAACIHAYGLDYNPTSERDAQRFLRVRRASLAPLLLAAREWGAR